MNKTGFLYSVDSDLDRSTIRIFTPTLTREWDKKEKVSENDAEKNGERVTPH